MNREKECDCWCKLDYCPLNCETKGHFISPEEHQEEMEMTESAAQMNVIKPIIVKP